MKYAGAVIVVAVFTLLGISKSTELTRRARCISAVIEALRYISSELRSAMTPLPVIFEELEAISKPETKKFFGVLNAGMLKLDDESFSELWLNALETGGLSLNTEQKTELQRLGQSLGRYSAEEQCAAIEACMARLEHEYAAALESSREGKKLYTGLGLATGLMLAAVLI